MKTQTDNTTVDILKTPRVRFNWGFWDGLYDHKHRRTQRDVSNHYDANYAAGYVAGFGWAGTPETSEDAWNEYGSATA